MKETLDVKTTSNKDRNTFALNVLILVIGLFVFAFLLYNAQKQNAELKSNLQEVTKEVISCHQKTSDCSSCQQQFDECMVMAKNYYYLYNQTLVITNNLYLFNQQNICVN